MVIYVSKKNIFMIIFLFLLSFLWHFMYDWFPSVLTSIFFPVNESIWEHMKIIFYCLFIGSVLEKKGNNYYLNILVKPLVGVLFYLIIFIPLYLIFGESMFISLSLMLFTYIIMELLGIKISKQEELNIKALPIIIIILISILFSILTFYPLHNFLFFDSVKLGYGILK
mgnify:FL=1